MKNAGPVVEIMGTVPLVENGRPIEAGAPLREAVVSPVDERHVLINMSNRGYVANMAAGSLTRIPRGGHPVAWMGPNILWREGSGTFSIIDGETLAPAVRVPLAHVDLPPSFARCASMDLFVQIPEGAAVNLPKTTADARVNDLVRIQDGERACHVQGEGLYRLLELRTGQDGRSFGVWNHLTGAWTEVPHLDDEWRWMPDGVTLVGMEWELGPARGDVGPFVTASHLRVLSLGEPASQRVELPSALKATHVSIVGMTPRGQLLVIVEAKDPKTPRALYLLGLRWPSR